MAWCHACRVEFREGIAACTDCGGALSADPPPPKQYASPALLAKTSSLEEAHAVRTLLEAHGIDCFLENEFGPAFAIGLPTLTVPYGLYVPSDQIESARELVAEARAEGAKAEPVERKPRRWWPLIVGTALLLVVVPDLKADGRQYTIGPWCAWGILLVGILHYLRSRHPGLLVPWPKLFAMAAAGAALGTIVALAPTLRWRGFWDGDRRVLLILVAPLLEEFGKILGVLFLRLINPDWFRRVQAWLIAGVAAGAGFGLVENVLYSHGVGDPASAFLSRSVVMIHLAATGVFAYMIARGGARGESGVARFIGGYAVAALMHGAWNGLIHVDVPVLPYLYGAILVIGLWRLLPSMIRVLDAQETKAGPPTEGPPVASTG